MDSITVKRLMNTETFRKNVKLIAGEDGLDKEVTYVTVQEAPDFYEFLNGGEFVLSTWYAFRNNHEEGLTSIKNLAPIASAVCIKSNRFIKEIPQEYIDYANKQALPLFVVDRDVIFREIIRCITIEINLSHMNTLIKANEYYDFLFRAALEGQTADSLLRDFYKRTKLWALSVSKDFEQIRGNRNFPNNDKSDKTVERVMAITKKNTTKLEYFYEDCYHFFPCMGRGYTKGYCYGYLIVISPGGLNEEQRLYANQLSNIITIKWMTHYETENDYLLSMLNMIKFSPEMERDEITRILNYHSIFCHNGIRTLILSYATKNKNKRSDYLAEAQQFLLELSANVSNTLFVWDRNELFTLLIGNQNGDDNRQTEALLAKCEELISSYSGLRLSIGPSVKSNSDLASSIRITQNAFLFCDFTSTKIIYFKECLADMSLLAGVSSKESELFVKETIQLVVDYDSKDGSNILKTLEVALRCSDLFVAAKILNMHTNSVRYRLQKIKQITGLDYFDVRDRFTIAVAFKIYKNKDKFK